MKKGYRISAHTKEMLKRYGSWDARTGKNKILSIRDASIGAGRNWKE